MVLSTATGGVVICVLYAVNRSAEDPEPFFLSLIEKVLQSACNKGSALQEALSHSSRQWLIPHLCLDQMTVNFNPALTRPECS